MVEERLIALIHGEIDGENSPPESAELERQLARNSEARRLFEEFSELAARLESLDDLTPPQDLKQAVLASIDRSRYQRPAASDKARYRIFRYAYAVAAGIVVGMLLGHQLSSGLMTPQPALQPDELTGTMLMLGDPAGLVEIAAEDVSASGVQGTILVRGSDEVIVLEMDVTSPRASSVNVGFDPESFSLRGLLRSSGQGPDLSVEQGRARFTVNGAISFGLLLSRRRGTESRLEVSIDREETRVYGKHFAIPPAGQ